MIISSIERLRTPPTIQALGQCAGTLLCVGNHIARTFRRTRSPHLFALGESIQNVLPNEKILTVTAHVIALAHSLLSVGQAIQEVHFSWDKLTSVRCIPSPTAILFMSAARNASAIEAAISMCADRLLQFIEYFYDTVWLVWTMAIEIYGLVCTVFWSEETAREAVTDILLNLQECGRILFDQERGDWRKLLHTIESSMAGALDCFGLKEITTPLFNVTTAGLSHMEKLYRHLPTSQGVMEAAKKGGELTVLTMLSYGRTVTVNH